MLPLVGVASYRLAVIPREKQKQEQKNPVDKAGLENTNNGNFLPVSRKGFLREY